MKGYKIEKEVNELQKLTQQIKKNWPKELYYKHLYLEQIIFVFYIFVKVLAFVGNFPAAKSA